MVRERLSLSAASLVPRLQQTRPDGFHCDLLIIGSGYGGAVAAARLGGTGPSDQHGLAGTPWSVWLLERGREHAPGSFPSRFADLPGHVRFSGQDGQPCKGRDEGLFDLRLGGELSALLGNGLGGGSLINAAVMEEPDSSIFDQRWPGALRGGASMQDGYAAATAMLRPETTPASAEKTKLVAFDRIAGSRVRRCQLAINQSCEPQTTTAGITLEACVACGDCITGCNYGAKGTLDTNYLALAGRRGVEIFCGGSALWLSAQEGGGFEVHWQPTDRQLRELSPGEQLLRARHVVLAAGAFGSTELLLRSREKGGLALSPSLGQGISSNGNWLAGGADHPQAVHATADEALDPKTREVGPTITGLHTVAPAAGAPGFLVEEFAVPGLLSRVFGELVTTVNAVLNLALPSSTHGAALDDPYAVTSARIDYLSLFGFAGDDAAGHPGDEGVSGHTAALPGPGAEGGLRIAARQGPSQALAPAQQSWFKSRLKADGAQPVRLPAQLSVHPLGGCRMGDTPEEGVVDDVGRVHGHPGLVVLDGSILPGPVGINPALTITALAERAALRLLSDWRLVDAAAPAAPPRAGASAPPWVAPRRFATWRIHEYLTGSLRLSGRDFHCAVEIIFEPIPGLRACLEAGPRTLPIAKGALVLSDGASRDAVPLSGDMILFGQSALEDDVRRTMRYQLQVGASAVLQIPAFELTGTKHIGNHPIKPARRDRNIWQQLSYMALTQGGDAVGEWTLDMDAHASQRNPLLHLLEHSSMPDALEDLGALLAYVARLVARPLNQLVSSSKPNPPNLAGRLPADLPGLDRSTVPLNGERARLTRYRPRTRVTTPPVVLVHGLGTSGSSFTLLDDRAPEGATPRSLAGFLGADREVWVLELRSSVAMENNRTTPAADEWTVQGVAQADLPAALRKVIEESGADEVDVVAHCMGAVMFCMAALGGHFQGIPLRRVVLSQVGPLVQLSPLNRLRGFAASYLQNFLGIRELDPCPVPIDSLVNGLLGGLAASFPYEEPGELERTLQAAGAAGNVGAALTRARGDWIFGQLFELAQLDASTLGRLDELLGWVKVPMLAQAIHFARYEMLIGDSGRNEV